ncbi:hypothetical protein AC622_03290 [Bacillus sp. FJAT-27916]|uniref:site-specific integrase n=1 Tax=Bacillus sp. FJAT-27916 TaxID=1679169 RepID=UPI0006715900|nr:site-specific integrase [Bacillus sp. FJAT-27916]KMY43397.1 hypothetical protein AC622_03290 [Bacillus sp. FJAT-27916]
MKGSITKRGSSYSVRVDIGKDHNGRRIQKSKSGFRTKRDAQEYLNQLWMDTQRRELSEEPFDQFVEKWFHTFYRRNVAETTAGNRWYLIQKHLVTYFGQTQLNHITARMLDEFYNEKLDEGLSTKTVRELHNLLNSVLSQAVKWSLLENNPVLVATPPKVRSKESTPWNQAQTEQFLQAIQGKPDETFFILAIFTGMRKGELLGLKWNDINLVKGKIHLRRSVARVKGKGLIVKDLKTKKSKRQISISPYVVKVLTEHRQVQGREKSQFFGYREEGIVFPTNKGMYKDPNNILRTFNRYIEKAEVPKITIHDLRHLHATLMLESGVNPKIVAERLGHSRVGVTLDLYSHVSSDIQEEAAIRFEEAFFQ